MKTLIKNAEIVTMTDPGYRNRYPGSGRGKLPAAGAAQNLLST